MPSPSPSHQFESGHIGTDPILQGWQDILDDESALEAERGINIKDLGTNDYRSGTTWDDLLKGWDGALDGQHNLNEDDFTKREWEKLLLPLRQEVKDNRNALRMMMLAYTTTDEDLETEDETSD